MPRCSLSHNNGRRTMAVRLEYARCRQIGGRDARPPVQRQRLPPGIGPLHNAIPEMPGSPWKYAGRLLTVVIGSRNVSLLYEAQEFYSIFHFSLSL